MTNRLFKPLTKTAALLLVAGFLALPQGTLAQPDDWVVTPSAYEFSMTLTYTIAIDGLVGQGSNNAAAIFAPDGTCRGWGVTDFAGPSGYSTGLILNRVRRTDYAKAKYRSCFKETTKEEECKKKSS